MTRVGAGFGSLVRYVSLRQLAASPLRSLLTLIGVALGVAMVVGTSATNVAVMRAFDELAERAGGKVDLEISGDDTGVPEELALALDGRPDLAAHVTAQIEQTSFLAATTPGQPGLRVLVLGVDLLGDTALLPFATGQGTDVLADPLGFVADPHAVLVGETLAHDRGLAPGSSLSLRTAHGFETFRVEAVLKETGKSRAFGGQLVVLSLDAAQLAFDRAGRVDRIDVALPAGVAFDVGRRALTDFVGARGIVDRPNRRAAQVARMTAAFRAGLSITGLVAVLVGMFLIFNAVSVSVAQRKREIGILRAVGVSRGRIAGVFLAEAALLGALGSAAGIGLGALLARAVVGQFAPNVSRFFENIAAPPTRVTPHLALSGLITGMLATLVAAWVPARRAARQEPVEALRRDRHQGTGRPTPVRRLLAVAALLGGAGAYLQTLRSQGGPLAALGLFFASAIFATPAVVVLLSPLAARAAQALFGTAARLGVDNVPRTLGRSALTVSALMLATSLSVTMSTYTHSYERSCLEWVEQAIPADVIVSAGSPLLDRNSVAFSPVWKSVVAAAPGVARVDLVRSMSVPYEDLRLEVLSLDSELYLGKIASSDYRRVVDGPAKIPVTALSREPAALVSENFAYKKHTRPGDTITLASPTGPHPFRVVAIVTDYSSDQGWVMIDRRFAVEYWQDERVEMLHVYLAAGADPQRVADDVRARLAVVDRDQTGLFVITNAAFKDEVRTVIRQTFGISKASEAIALIVAVLGVIGTMLAGVIDRLREIGVLRAIGAVRRQILVAVACEAGWLGLCACLVGTAAAIPASRVFVNVISVQASGWRVPWAFPYAAVAQTTASVTLLAAASGMLPGWKAARLAVRDALAYE